MPRSMPEICSININDLHLLLERLAGKETMPGVHGFCSFYSFGAIRGKQLLRLTALIYWACLKAKRKT